MKKEVVDENDVTITIEQSDAKTQSAPQKQSKAEEGSADEQDDEMNGYSESEDSDEEGQLRIAEEDNCEVSVVDNYYHGSTSTQTTNLIKLVSLNYFPNC